MTQEEKAKAYDKAIERARNLHKDAIDMGESLRAKQCEIIFPELAESEDERIRKEIVRFIQMEVEDEIVGNKWIAWLKRQDEHKKQVHFPKFTFDDVLALQCCMETAKKVQEDKELYEQLQSLHDRLYDAYWLEKQEEKPVEEYNIAGIKTKQHTEGKLAEIIKDIESADKIEALRTEYEKGRADAIAEMQVAWSEEDEKMVNNILTPLAVRYPFNIYQPMYNWLKSLKQRIGG